MHSSSAQNSLISDLLLSFHITKSHLSSSKKLLHGCCTTQMFGVRCAALVDYLQRRARSLVHTVVIRHETRPSSATPKPHQPPMPPHQFKHWHLYDNHEPNSLILKQESSFIFKSLKHDGVYADSKNDSVFTSLMETFFWNSTSLIDYFGPSPMFWVYLSRRGGERQNTKYLSVLLALHMVNWPPLTSLDWRPVKGD